MKKIRLLIFVNLSFMCATASAVTFSFLAGSPFENMDSQSQASGTVDGTQLTLRATSALNPTQTPNQFFYFGGLHGFWALLENGLTFSMEFDKTVQIRQFVFENLGDPIADALGFKLLIGGVEERDVTIPDFSASQPLLSTAVLAAPLTVPANTAVTFQGVVPSSYTNGVVLGMHNMVADVVPEPTSCALGLGLGTVLIIAVRRRRIKKPRTQY